MGGVTIKDTGVSYKETLSMPRDEKTAHIKDVPYMSPQWLDMFAHIVPDAGGKGTDLTEKVNKDRRLTWDVPEGVWTLVCCYRKPSGVFNMSTSPSGKGLHHDHLSTAAADLHLKNVAGRMLAKLGTFENTAFDGLNHDSWELGNPTWTPGFRGRATDRSGDRRRLRTAGPDARQPGRAGSLGSAQK